MKIGQSARAKGVDLGYIHLPWPGLAWLAQDYLYLNQHL
jgi:hypothetical protein